jgi:hypothetical protein
MVWTSPSRRATVGSQPRNVRARVMSGCRRVGRGHRAARLHAGHAHQRRHVQVVARLGHACDGGDHCASPPRGRHGRPWFPAEYAVSRPTALDLVDRPRLLALGVQGVAAHAARHQGGCICTELLVADRAVSRGLVGLGSRGGSSSRRRQGPGPRAGSRLDAERAPRRRRDGVPVVAVRRCVVSLKTENRLKHKRKL